MSENVNPTYPLASRHDRHDMGLRRPSRHMNVPLGVHEDVDLTADAELGEVDARFDRKTGPRQDAPLLARFQVVHIGTVTVRFLADRMPGAVEEVFAVASLL